MNNLATLTLTTALLLTGCASLTPPSLPLDTTYKVEWIGERPLIDRSHLTVTLGADDRAHGHAGCNRWFASYQAKGNQLSISQAGATRMMCAPALMEQEGRFLQALGQVKRWEMGENGELRLWYAEDQALRLLAE
jgi:heat shock protein HslJ